MKKRNKKYRPRSIVPKIVIELQKIQQHHFKIDSLVREILEWLRHTALYSESDVNSKNEYAIKIMHEGRERLLPAWHGFESLTDIYEHATVRGLIFDSSLIERMRNWCKNDMPISPEFADETYDSVVEFACALKSLSPDVMRAVTNDVLTRIYMQRLTNKGEIR